jgi:hypothetical protein
MRFLRLRLRSLVILIALAGVCLGGVVLWRRSLDYSRLAWIAENDEAEAREFLREAAEVADDEELSREFLMMRAGHVRPRHGAATEQVATLATFFRRRLNHYVSLVAKYRRGARHPWLFVPPDPPLPEVPAEFALP